MDSTKFCTSQWKITALIKEEYKFQTIISEQNCLTNKLFEQVWICYLIG